MSDAERSDTERLDVHATLELPPATQSPSRARRFIADFCEAADLPAELCQTAALLVSELVTNAIVHGRSSATVEIHRPPERLRVAVGDHNPDLPPVERSPLPTAEGGRGLMIVALMAHDWGVEHAPDGKVVWFELALP